MFSASANGAPPSPGSGRRTSGNLWRTTGDIGDIWDAGGKKADGLGRRVQILDILDGLESYAGPGHWNDPDMLEVGNGGMTDHEYRAHFSLWAMLAAPLMAGNDIRSMSADIHDILTNKEVIAVDQDSLGKQGHRVKGGENGAEVWSKQMSDGSRAVALLNRGGSEQQITVNWTDIGYPEQLKASVRDLWQHKNLDSGKGSFSASVPSHGVAMVLIRPE